MDIIKQTRKARRAPLAAGGGGGGGATWHVQALGFFRLTTISSPPKVATELWATRDELIVQRPPL